MKAGVPTAMEVEMDTGDEVRGHLNALHEAVWELAAIVVALRDPVGSENSSVGVMRQGGTR